MSQSPATQRHGLLKKAGESAFGLLGALSTRDRQLPKLTREFKDEQADHHAFDSKEVEDFYTAFMKASSDGHSVKLSEFTKVMEIMGITDPLVVESTFHAWDMDKSGSLEFREFLTALSVLNKGSMDEKLDLAFRVFDVHQTGYVDKRELEKMFTAFTAVNGRILAADDITTLIDKMFSKLNHPGATKITKIEFTDLVATDLELRNDFTHLLNVEDLVSAMRRSHIHSIHEAHRAIKVTRTQLDGGSGKSSPPQSPALMPAAAAPQ
eukprot:TRINITY_DN5443_c0_g1_i1.p1 TRINITY_DN5443_c0_g1~~TRINITY_DN5443_c0_g1_i1.p1  ORF type:complete len:266 (-),score=68.15 TRINITY_DN5443_c0_g1_i1:444-1241(-)